MHAWRVMQATLQTSMSTSTITTCAPGVANTIVQSVLISVSSVTLAQAGTRRCPRGLGRFRCAQKLRPAALAAPTASAARRSVRAHMPPADRTPVASHRRCRHRKTRHHQRCRKLRRRCSPTVYCGRGRQPRSGRKRSHLLCRPPRGESGQSRCLGKTHPRLTSPRFRCVRLRRRWYRYRCRRRCCCRHCLCRRNPRRRKCLRSQRAHHRSSASAGAAAAPTDLCRCMPPPRFGTAARRSPLPAGLRPRGSSAGKRRELQRHRRRRPRQVRHPRLARPPASCVASPRQRRRAAPAHARRRAHQVRPSLPRGALPSRPPLWLARP
mmetsp:Transcript_9259/g.28185  ORF Transcript_9259/g.28185 Transcript_9259/m.28185 type:complete len:324 (+) Transcript_9259:1312-2283(+)